MVSDMNIEKEWNAHFVHTSEYVYISLAFLSSPTISAWGPMLPEDKRESIREEIMNEWGHKNFHGGKRKHGNKYGVARAGRPAGWTVDGSWGNLTAIRKRHQRGRTLAPGKTHRVLLHHDRLAMIKNKIQPEMEMRMMSPAKIHQEHICVVEQVGCMTRSSQKEHTTLSLTGCYKESIVGFGLWLGDLGKSLRKWDFTLGWMLSESGGKSMREWVSQWFICKEGQPEQR